jgi:hypothetical protein
MPIRERSLLQWAGWHKKYRTPKADRFSVVLERSPSRVLLSEAKKIPFTLRARIKKLVGLA